MGMSAQAAEISAKHQQLESEIERELAKPRADDLFIQELKRRKLALKDRLESISGPG